MLLPSINVKFCSVMPKLVIDGQNVEIATEMTVMQACNLIGIEIPHFCYHKKLSVAGNCRMCLVEVEGNSKLIASCCAKAGDNMVIYTSSVKVKKAREGVMELLLINHPLDCPICDQGGECDLQDQAFKYGRGSSRFRENKRSVCNKYMGPLIKTNMTRCIHCTRCVRFATEVAGIQELGILYRGENTEIVSYLEHALTSELSGNMIDICPVGALTSWPYAFKARRWELKKTESIDVMDALGSNITIHNRGLEIMRILPRSNEEINEEWISDKARFSYDGLKNSRLDRPYIKINGKLKEASWHEALIYVADKLRNLNGHEIGAIAGTLTPVEPLLLIKNLFAALHSTNIDANQFGYKLDRSARGNYLFNTTIMGVEQADLCLLIGANPRIASPVLNSRIGKQQRRGKLHVARIGDIIDLTYSVEELGDDIRLLSDIANGKHNFTAKLCVAKNPMIIIGDGIYSRDDSYAALSIIHDIVIKYNIVRNDWNGFNILHNHASIIGSFDIGFVPEYSGYNVSEMLKQAKAGNIKLLYLLGADEINTAQIDSTFCIYQGHHGDVGAHIADIILPAAAYTEQDGTYVNLEGRAQIAKAATKPPGQAKPDWMIIRDLASYLNINLDAESLEQIRVQMSQFSPVFNNIGKVIRNEVTEFVSDDKLLTGKISSIHTNYYMTNSISRASVTMAKCIQARQHH